MMIHNMFSTSLQVFSRSGSPFLLKLRVWSLSHFAICNSVWLNIFKFLTVAIALLTSEYLLVSSASTFDVMATILSDSLLVSLHIASHISSLQEIIIDQSML